MVHSISERTQPDEKELKRLNFLEQRVVEVENELLRKSAAALEKRVAELEASLKASNEECDKLRQTVADMKSSEKNIIPSKKEDSVESKDVLFCSDDDTDISDISDISDNDKISGVISAVSINDKEEEIIYGRILKLIENMKSDCLKAINSKKLTESHLPKFGLSSKSPSPTEGLTSPKLMGRSRTPSVVGILSIPTSRAGTPSGAISPQNPIQITQLSQISQISRISPTKSPSSPSHNKTSHIPSRASTPSGHHSPSSPSSPPHNKTSHIPSRASTPSGHHSPSNNIPISLQNRKRSNSRVTWSPACPNNPPRPSTPPPSTFNSHPTGMTGIPRRLATC